MMDVQNISELAAIILRDDISGFSQDDLDQLYADHDDPNAEESSSTQKPSSNRSHAFEPHLRNSKNDSSLYPSPHSPSSTSTHCGLRSTELHWKKASLKILLTVTRNS